ncbi:MAG: hypothetical protein M1827_003837 [Pycnora praestabilis]|nr:MAG: hypothetical protein M1827_003837 [Pycnora praestabilis]
MELLSRLAKEQQVHSARTSELWAAFEAERNSMLVNVTWSQKTQQQSSATKSLQEFLIGRDNLIIHSPLQQCNEKRSSLPFLEDLCTQLGINFKRLEAAGRKQLTHVKFRKRNMNLDFPQKMYLDHHTTITLWDSYLAGRCHVFCGSDEPAWKGLGLDLAETIADDLSPEPFQADSPVAEEFWIVLEAHIKTKDPVLRSLNTMDEQKVWVPEPEIVAEAAAHAGGLGLASDAMDVDMESDVQNLQHKGEAVVEKLS